MSFPAARVLPLFYDGAHSKLRPRTQTPGCAQKLLSRQSDMMSKVRRALYLQVGSAIAMALLLSIASRFFPITDWLSQAQLKIMHLGAWSAICYPLLYACCNVLLLPGGLLSIGGGFFFGLWWGFLIVFVGNITGAAIAFLISRWLGRGWLRQKLRRIIQPFGCPRARG